MRMALLFLSGLFFANGIPHFVNGISGKEFATPFLYRYMKWMPSPLFNVIWGLLNFGLSLFLFTRNQSFSAGMNWDSFMLGFGFVFASTGLSVFFKG